MIAAMAPTAARTPLAWLRLRTDHKLSAMTR